MTAEYYNHNIEGREVFIDYRYDRVKVLQALEKVFKEYMRSNYGFISVGKTIFAEVIDAELYPFYPAVDTHIDSNKNIYYTIYIEWNEEILYRESEMITKKVYNVLRGLPA